MAKLVDLVGKRYGRLVVLERVENATNGSSRWLCKCDCGSTRIHTAGTLNSGVVQSCGCYGKESRKKQKVTHNKSNTRLYRVWASMKERCFSSSCKSFVYYGARGISVCDEWKDSFQAFYDWALANGYCEGLSIDRIDVNGNYEPLNCRWVSRNIQANNTRKNVNVEYNGECHTIGEWADILGIKYITLWMRFQRGWDISKALRCSGEVVT
jgi:hypothetical protein